MPQSKTKRSLLNQRARDREFADRIAAFDRQIKRLRDIQSNNGEFIQTFVRKTTVKRHQRKAYWMLRAVKKHVHKPGS